MSDALVLAELRRIEAALCERLDRIEDALSRGRLDDDERGTLRALYAAALPIVGDDGFDTLDLFDVPPLASVVAGYSPASLSWLFRRAEGLPIDGICVRRVSTTRSGALWRLEGRVARNGRRAMR